MSGGPSQPPPDGRPRPPALGRLGFRRCLGEGGMGQVWLAWDEVLCVDRAVKLPQPRFARDPGWRECMLREARVLAQLSHPGIARLHEFVIEGDRCALVMEYVRGLTLRQILSADGRLGPDEAQRICRSIAEAVETAHTHPMRIVHCDLKPGNVMVAEDGAVKVLDWGIAVREQRDGAAAGRHSGTPGYTAPEVVGALEWPGRAADLFSLGAILFECLAGERAFPGISTTERLERTLHGEPAWARLPDATPSAVRSLLRRLLEKDPRLRCTDVGEVVGVLAAPQRPVRRSPNTASNLPAPTTRFVGRERELAALRSRLGSARAVVVHGLGGMGKTALALEAARALADDRLVGAFPDGVWLIRLGALEDAALLEEQVASAVPSLAAGSTESLATRLSDRSLLLILDRCEHLEEAVSALSRTLLEQCPGVRLLATSRTPLAIPGASLLRLGPLETRGGVEGESPAAALFIDSARRVLHEFEPAADDRATIDALVERLDGIPLAVEIAAAWLSRCELSDLLPNIAMAAPLTVVEDVEQAGAARDAAGRRGDESVLEAVVVGSIGRLPAAARRLLGRLAVFRAGWTLDAAQRVCGDADGPLASTLVPTVLGELVDRSLVEFERAEGGRRYRMLRPVRTVASRILDEEPAAARGEPGSRQTIEANLGRWCMELVEGGTAAHAATAGRHLESLAREWPNIRAAIELAFEADDLAAASGLALGLHRVWYARGMHREGWTILERILERRSRADGGGDPLLPARLHNAAGLLRWHAGDLDAADAHFEAAAGALTGASAVRVGPGPVPASDGAPPPHPALVALKVNRALVAKDRARTDHALELLAAARDLARTIGSRVGQAQAELNAAVILQEAGRLDDAVAMLAAALPTLEGDAALAEFHAEAIAVRGLVAMDRGSLESAGDDLARALAMARRQNTLAKLALRVWAIATLAERRGRHQSAAVLRSGARRLARDLGIHEPQLRRAEDDGTIDRLRRRLGATGFSDAERAAACLGVAELLEMAEAVARNEGP